MCDFQRISALFDTSSWECHEVLKTTSSVLDHGKRSVNRVVWKGVKGVYTAMVNYPYKEWDTVDTFFALIHTKN